MEMIAITAVILWLIRRKKTRLTPPPPPLLSTARNSKIMALIENLQNHKFPPSRAPLLFSANATGSTGVFYALLQVWLILVRKYWIISFVLSLYWNVVCRICYFPYIIKTGMVTRSSAVAGMDRPVRDCSGSLKFWRNSKLKFCVNLGHYRHYERPTVSKNSFSITIDKCSKSQVKKLTKLKLAIFFLGQIKLGARWQAWVHLSPMRRHMRFTISRSSSVKFSADTEIPISTYWNSDIDFPTVFHSRPNHMCSQVEAPLSACEENHD